MIGVREVAPAADSGPARDSDTRSAIRLRCPQCKASLGEQCKCSSCSFLMKEKDGILLALAPDRLAHYANFIADYEHIRAAEGRGSQDKSYYLALPHQDTT